MGIITEAIKKLDQASEQAAKEVKASLEMLSQLSNAKQDEMSVYIDDRVRHAEEKGEIPAGLKMFEAAETHVVSSKGPSEGITKALDSFLNDTEVRWKDAVKSLIGTAVNSLLGAAAGATSNQTYYIIALDGHAASEKQEETYVPIRLDYCLWVYNFKRQGITDTVESAIVYHARKSLLDLEKIPSKLQVEMALKNIGTPKELREELISYLEGQRYRKNLPAYLAARKDPGLDTAVRTAYPLYFAG